MRIWRLPRPGCETWSAPGLLRGWRTTWRPYVASGCGTREAQRTRRAWWGQVWRFACGGVLGRRPGGRPFLSGRAAEGTIVRSAGPCRPKSCCVQPGSRLIDRECTPITRTDAAGKTIYNLPRSCPAPRCSQKAAPANAFGRTPCSLGSSRQGPRVGARTESAKSRSAPMGCDESGCRASEGEASMSHRSSRLSSMRSASPVSPHIGAVLAELAGAEQQPVSYPANSHCPDHAGSGWEVGKE